MSKSSAGTTENPGSSQECLQLALFQLRNIEFEFASMANSAGRGRRSLDLSVQTDDARSPVQVARTHPSRRENRAVPRRDAHVRADREVDEGGDGLVVGVHRKALLVADSRDRRWESCQYAI